MVLPDIYWKWQSVLRNANIVDTATPQTTEQRNVNICPVSGGRLRWHYTSSSDANLRLLICITLATVATNTPGDTRHQLHLMLITLASDAGGDQQWIPGRVLPASAHYKAIALQYCITIGQWCFCIVLVSTCKMGTETPVIILLYLSHLLRTQHTPPGGLTVICRLCNCINCTNVTQIILAYFRTTAIE